MARPGISTKIPKKQSPAKQSFSVFSGHCFSIFGGGVNSGSPEFRAGGYFFSIFCRNSGSGHLGSLWQAGAIWIFCFKVTPDLWQFHRAFPLKSVIPASAGSRKASIQQDASITWISCDLFRPRFGTKMPENITSHDVLKPSKQVLSALRDVIISDQICGSKLQRVFTLGDDTGCPSIIRNLTFPFEDAEVREFSETFEENPLRGVKGFQSLQVCGLHLKCNHSYESWLAFLILEPRNPPAIPCPAMCPPKTALFCRKVHFSSGKCVFSKESALFL